MKTPNPKTQNPNKLQISSSNQEPPQRGLDLLLGISLELGVWDLGFVPLTTNHE